MEERRAAAAEKSGRYVLLTKGPPCLGKTTLATALAKALRAPLLCKDDINDFLQPPNAALNAAAYRILLASAARLASLPLRSPFVVAESNLSLREHLAFARRRVPRSVNVLVVELYISEDGEWQRRVDARVQRVEAGGCEDERHKIAPGLRSVSDLRKREAAGVAWATDLRTARWWTRVEVGQRSVDDCAQEVLAWLAALEDGDGVFEMSESR